MANDTPVIVGMACRVPGAETPSKLWDNIVQQKDLWRKMPKDRFNIDAFYHPNRANKGTTNTKYGYFLDQPLGHFDAEFFGISGKEAAAMDPQQRLLLEVVYEALEDAGIPLEQIRGTDTSVYCGTFANANDYNSLQGKDLEFYPIYALTGTGNPIVSNRISYFYNLHGPSMTIDTACSSSLVGFHLGCQSLKSGESGISIIVGSALQFAPNIYQTISDMGFLSDDGRCRCFDESGSGYVRGDGICAVILKRHGDAVQNGDRIRALVRGTAINHDGRTEGITLPSAEAQEALLRKAYSNAGINPDHTQYFEAHGTGTRAGDPREARAMGAVFGTKTRKEPLWVGSVKPNIGHLEGAAGLSGLIKTTLALEKGLIPPNMLFENPNPDIDFEGWKLRVPQSTMIWETPAGISRRASINSSGYGGANAHIILESYPDTEDVALDTNSHNLWSGGPRPYLLPITSHTKDAGQLAVRALRGYLQYNSDTRVTDLAFSLSTRRSMHNWRTFVIGQDQASILDNLDSPSPTASWVSTTSSTRRIGFVFTGQGAQIYDMGRELIYQSPLFKSILEACDSVLHSLSDGPSWSIVTELLREKDSSKLTQSQFSQPICTALQIGLVCLIKEWGIHPSAVCGHSSGEIAAAYAAGILTLEAAIVVAYYRGLHMGKGVDRICPGAMMSVGLGRHQATVELEAYQGLLTIAAFNAPTSVTISGDKAAILELKKSLDARNIFARLLKVEQAFHSHHMIPLAPDYQKALEDCPYFDTKDATCRMFSSVEGRVINADRMHASYWAQNMVRPVRFSDALVGIVLDENEERNVDVLLEIGPHPALKGPTAEILAALRIELPYLGTLSRGKNAYNCLLESAGQLFQIGYPVDLESVNRDQALVKGTVCHVSHAKRLHDLPSYSWNHKNYWFTTRLVDEYVHRPWRHVLVGAPVPGSIKNMPRFRNYIRLSEIPWLKDHVIDGKVVFPAAGFVCMAIEAGVRLETERVRIRTIQLRDVIIKAALTLQEDSEQGSEVLLELYPLTTSSRTTSDNWYEFAISSYDETNDSTEHCRGRIHVEYGSSQPIIPTKNRPSPDELFQKADRYMTPMVLYSRLDSLNSHYGERFALLKNDIVTGPGFAVTNMSFDPSFQSPHELSQRIVLHPTLLDASFHVMFPVIEALLGRQMTDAFVSTFMGSIDISGSLAQIAGKGNVQNYTIATFTELPSPRVAINDILIYQPDGQVVVEAQNVEATAVETYSEKSRNRTLFFRQRWNQCFDFISDKNQEHWELPSLVDCYTFQYPLSNILYITARPEEVRQLRSCLWFEGTQRHRFERLQIHTGAPNEEVSKERNFWPSGLVHFGEPEGKYDLIIAGTEATKVATPELLTLLRESGVLISTETPTESEKFDQIIAPSPLGVFRLKPAECGKIDMTIVLPIPYKTSELTDNIYHKLISSNEIRSAQKTDFGTLYEDGLSTPVIVVLANLAEQIESSEHSWIGVRSLLMHENATIVWVLQGAAMNCPNPEHAKIMGLLRTARNENTQSRFITIDMDTPSSAELISKRILDVLRLESLEEEFADRGGSLYIPRVEEDVELNQKLPHGVGNEPKPKRFGDYHALTLRIGQVGLLESLHFVENEEITGRVLGDEEVEISVMASSVNFHDIAVAMGIIQDYKMGDECAGYVVRTGSKVDSNVFKPGDRVVAFNPGMGAHGTLVRSPALFCHKIPENFSSFSDIASLPVILSTALYCLVHVARLQQGETVLIHAAAGGVGQMAIQIAQNIGARVLATCSKPKREFLRTEFGLSDDQIFSSRDFSFVKGVLQATNGEGVDVVLNSVAGDLLLATWGCIKKFGRFIEIGKRDIHQNSNLAMEPFRRNATFAAVDMVLLFEERPEIGSRVLAESLKLFFDGCINAPKTLHVFPYSQVEKAFRLLQLGRKPGKVVLVPDKEESVLVKPPTFQHKQIFNPAKSYLLVGGLGGLGTAMSEWMLLRGAKKLAFLSRSGCQTADASKTVEWLKSKGVDVTIYQGDVAEPADVTNVIRDIGPSLAGVFHIAVSLQDSLIRSMTLQQLQNSVRTKCQGAMNLHNATLGVKLDFFVCFSSVSGICGNKGQAAYVAANAWVDAFMRWRREQGLVATAMNAGTVTTRGLVAQSSSARQSLERNKLDTLTEQELMYLVEEAVSLDFPKRDPQGLDWHQVIVGVNVRDPDVFWSERSLFRNLYANRRYGKISSAGNGITSLATLLQKATSLESIAEAVLEAFVMKIASVLGTPINSIIPSNPLSFYGLDSIVAVEFRRWFMECTGVEISLFDILAAKSIETLVTRVVTQMPQHLDGGSWPGQNNDEKEANTRSKHESSRAVSRITKRKDAHGPIAISAFQLSYFPVDSLRGGDYDNLSAVLTLKGNPSVASLEAALEILIHRHPALRTAFHQEEECIMQHVIAEHRFPFTYIGNLDSSSSAQNIDDVLMGHRNRSFNIKKGELGSAVLIKTEEMSYILLVVVHPISFDRSSMAHFLTTWVDLYEAVASNQGTTMIPYPRLSYSDFTVWHNKQLETPWFLLHEQFWKSNLAGLPPMSRLLPECVITTKKGRGQLRVPLGSNLLRRMKRICANLEATPFDFMLAAFRACIFRHTSQRDMSILMIDERRPHADVEELIGCFLNLVPLRVRISCNDMSFEELLVQAKQVTLHALEHRDVPFEKIIKALDIDRTLDNMPIGRVAINYRSSGKSEAVYRSSDFELVQQHDMTLPLPLDMVIEAVEDDDKGVYLLLDYPRTKYAPTTIERFLDNFTAFLTSLIQDHRQSIADVHLPAPIDQLPSPL